MASIWEKFLMLDCLSSFIMLPFFLPPSGLCGHSVFSTGPGSLSLCHDIVEAIVFRSYCHTFVVQQKMSILKRIPCWNHKKYQFYYLFSLNSLCTWYDELGRKCHGALVRKSSEKVPTWLSHKPAHFSSWNTDFTWKNNSRQTI